MTRIPRIPMDDGSCAPSATSARPGRVRASALSTAVPIALAVGAVFAAPIAATVPHETLHHTTGAILADKCQSPTAHVALASNLTFGAAGVAKWPDCAGD